MTWDDIFKIVAGVVVSFGGISAIIVLLITFASNFIAQRLQEKYTLKLNKELETHIAGLQKMTHIGKSNYDREFQAYQGLIDVYIDTLLQIKTLVEADIIDFLGVTYTYRDYEKFRRDNVLALNKTIIKSNRDLYKKTLFIDEKLCNTFEEIQTSFSSYQTLLYERIWARPQTRYEQSELKDFRKTDRVMYIQLDSKMQLLMKEIHDYLKAKEEATHN